MEDTLRYFFSAIFQGIAAILTLGAMFYMNYLDKTRARIKELEKEVYEIHRPDSKQRNDVIKSNIIEVLIKIYSLPKYDNEFFIRHNLIAEEYLQIVKKQNEIKSLLPSLVIYGTILLMFSSISLFLVGYSENLNLVLFAIGMLTLLITFAFLMNLLSIIVVSTELEGFKYLKLLFLKKSKDKTLV